MKGIGIYLLSNMNLKYILFILFLSLSGCSTFDSSRIATGYVEAFQSINRLLFGYGESSFTADLIKEIPYASQIIKIGKGPEGLMILESKKEKENTWVSADGIYIVQRSGKVIETKNLTNNLEGLVSNVDFSNLLNLDFNQSYIYYVSFSDPELFNLKLKAYFSIKQKESVTLLGKNLELTLIEELVRSEKLGWEVKNLYWVDENSFIWKSEQTISPKLPKIFFEVTKKPS